MKLKGYWAGERRTVIVPLHDELAFGTLRSILRQAGLDGKRTGGLIRMLMGSVSHKVMQLAPCPVLLVR